MSVIDRIKARHDRLSSIDGRPYLDVPEWGDETGPLRVFWKPVTPRDINKSAKNDSRGNSELVALKAEDAAGKRMFPELEDAVTLHSIGDHAVVARIALAMIATPSVPEAIKN